MNFKDLKKIYRKIKRKNSGDNTAAECMALIVSLPLTIPFFVFLTKKGYLGGIISALFGVIVSIFIMGLANYFSSKILHKKAQVFEKKYNLFKNYEKYSKMVKDKNNFSHITLNQYEDFFEKIIEEKESIYRKNKGINIEDDSLKESLRTKVYKKILKKHFKIRILAFIAPFFTVFISLILGLFMLESSSDPFYSMIDTLKYFFGTLTSLGVLFSIEKFIELIINRKKLTKISNLLKINDLKYLYKEVYDNNYRDNRFYRKTDLEIQKSFEKIEERIENPEKIKNKPLVINYGLIFKEEKIKKEKEKELPKEHFVKRFFRMKNASLEKRC